MLCISETQFSVKNLQLNIEGKFSRKKVLIGCKIVFFEVLLYLWNYFLFEARPGTKLVFEQNNRADYALGI